MTVTLKQLADLFVESASNPENPVGIRRFASQLALLTRHLARVEAQSDKQIAELATHVLQLRTALKSAPPAPAGEAPAAPQGASIDDETEALIAKAQAESAAEASAINASANKTALVSVPKTNGQPTTEAAS